MVLGADSSARQFWFGVFHTFVVDEVRVESQVYLLRSFKVKACCLTGPQLSYG